MHWKLLLIFLLSIPRLAYGQLSTIHADSSKLRNYAGNSASSMERVMQMEWRIKGQSFHWGDSILIAPASTGVDTVFFRLRQSADWDTLISKMNPGSTTRFVYNACCDYFDSVDEHGEIIQGKVLFQMVSKQKEAAKYFGTIDGTGVMVLTNSNAVTPIHRSPMFPNNYHVALSEIKNCSGSNCNEAVLVRPDNSYNVNFKYRVLRSMVSFRYLPLNAEPVIISYAYPNTYTIR